MGCSQKHAGFHGNHRDLNLKKELIAYEYKKNKT